jgi:hypothetical protein
MSAACSSCAPLAELQRVLSSNAATQRLVRDGLAAHAGPSVTLQSPFAAALLAMSSTACCTHTLSKEPSVRQKYDGGKWLCGVKDIHRSNCVVYSFGSNANTVFEAHLPRQCEIHVFDPFKLPARTSRREWQLHPLGIVGGSTNITMNKRTFVPLANVMAMLKHDCVDVLKIECAPLPISVLPLAPC